MISETKLSDVATVPHGYKSTVIGVIPKDWAVSPLKTLYPEIRNGFVGTATPFYVDKGVKYLQGKNIKRGRIVPDELVNVSEDFHIKQSKSRLRLDDIVMVQSGHVGECAVINEEYEDSNCHALIVMSPTVNVDSRYYSYLFNSNYGERLFYKIRTGNTVEHILASDMKELLVPVPSLREQQQIALIIATWDQSIELMEQLIELMKAQMQSVAENLLKGIVRWDDGEKTSHNDIMRRVESIRMGVVPPGYKKTNIGIIPNDWSEKTFSEISTINEQNLTGSTVDGYQFYYYDLSSADNGSIEHPAEKITFDRAPSRARRKFHRNDVLMSTVRPYLKGFAYVDFDCEDCICSTGFAVISGNPVDTKLIYYNLYTHGIENQINKFLTGSNYPAINSGDVERLIIPYPPDSNERYRIVEIIATYDQAIKLYEQKRDLLQEQKKGIIQSLVTGKVRV